MKNDVLPPFPSRVFFLRVFFPSQRPWAFSSVRFFLNFFVALLAKDPWLTFLVVFFSLSLLNRLPYSRGNMGKYGVPNLMGVFCVFGVCELGYFPRGAWF